MTRIGDYFISFAAKKLSAVDIGGKGSNQNEIGGKDDFRAMFGAPADVDRYDARFVYLNDSDDIPDITEAGVSWYDPRRRGARTAEYRLYYAAKAKPVVSLVEPGDTLFVARHDERTVYMIFAKAGTTILRQLEWMFGLTSQGSVMEGLDVEHQPELVPMPAEELLSLLGIEVDLSDDSLISRIPPNFFAGKWPSGAEMAKLARSLVDGADTVSEPDLTLLNWVQMEMRIFQTVEKRRIAGDIAAGFVTPAGDVDVDAFLKLSLSVNNRRKSRAGGSLELHIEEILKGNGILHGRQATTEGKKKPDFLFPSKTAYHDSAFPVTGLTMLGAKTTLKDRWRQVLNEANRIEKKHLLTMQPGISEDQTDEMKAENLQLVIPASLHGQGFSDGQRRWLMTVHDFLNEVRDRQAVARGASVSTNLHL